MKKFLFFLGCCLFIATTSRAQLVGVTTNLAGWAAFGTINAGAEAALTPNITAAIDGYYNPFTGSDGKSTRFWAVQPEFRYWLKTKFTGHFVGLHSMYVNYDFGRNLYRYDGWMTGVGLSYGYSLAFSPRWRATANIGAGWTRRDYEKSGLPQSPDNIIYYGDNIKNGFSITKAAITITYIIR
ncbi:MAG: DUF3575 domain-containing protein [Rikenellaceae bacterium]